MEDAVVPSLFPVEQTACWYRLSDDQQTDGFAFIACRHYSHFFCLV